MNFCRSQVASLNFRFQCDFGAIHRRDNAQVSNLLTVLELRKNPHVRVQLKQAFMCRKGAQWNHRNGEPHNEN